MLFTEKYLVIARDSLIITASSTRETSLVKKLNTIDTLPY
jgi:hypothetical protein